MKNPMFSQRVLNVGFLGALLLAAIAFLAAGYYLLQFASTTQEVVSSMMSAGQQSNEIDIRNLELLQNGLTIHAYLARVLLISCGMFVALAFGFLGFALFLVGANGSSNAEISASERLQFTITNLAPGSIAIVGATLLAAICVTRSMPVEFSFGGGVVSKQSEDADDLIRSSEPSYADEIESQESGDKGMLEEALSRPDPELPD